MFDLGSIGITARRFRLQGLVQGQGIRPTIANLATSNGIKGHVRNSPSGVEIQAWGDEPVITNFKKMLQTTFANAVLRQWKLKTDGLTAPDHFRIIESTSGPQLHTTVPLDLAICSDCLTEVRNSADRRHGYPFTTCTRCGPRYSMLNAMPFDRDSTSMSAFPMCTRCASEYRDPRNRRFHAQTIACPDCGPQCWTADRNGHTIADKAEALQHVAERIRRGDIAAVKGIGGYQFICDATNGHAVSELRRRKLRPTKPLPVMVGDVDSAQQFASINATERDALQSTANPIVLLRGLENRSLCRWISPNLNTIGVMLPTSALHALLLDFAGRPLVVTSGNVHGSPLVFQNSVAACKLGDIADVFLHHDREISNPIDDSVVQCVGEQVVTIRAARGIAPMTLSTSMSRPMLAVGGHQKVAPAIQTNESLVLMPHIGDMDSESGRVRFIESIDRLQSLYQFHPSLVAHDAHPNYFATDWAVQHSDSAEAVQHHHAHVAAAMHEHQLLDRSVLGISFDGTGFGRDETIWGGEVLLARRSSYQRIGHLRPFRLPGGESAIKQPWRIAASLRSQINEQTVASQPLRVAIEQGPITSSMGRLFDAIASIVLDIESVAFEGEAAMRLEAACDRAETNSYEFQITNDDPLQFDWRPVLIDVENDLPHVSRDRIAMRFHRAVAELVIKMADRHRELPCVITGGVFQNRTLSELIQTLSEINSLDIRMPGAIPINDGGLAIGQLVVASSLKERTTESSDDSTSREPLAELGLGEMPCA
ncbi:carbamoyltransferase HypF [Aporhodopirellula aestuarii]|uniref:Carbamoyltransferase n=1 Tax=Aporhodopirellula aestuarii TaxID=2950107 RepID=A0ABT0TZN8_9BACT|nr:carbamoyltransferase HypF [Aporhodopirellula aestuarii]MCM2369698.1 carbamoyltransferase HypF [Aporhodopirellula aestuarii]